MLQGRESEVPSEDKPLWLLVIIFMHLGLLSELPLEILQVACGQLNDRVASIVLLTELHMNLYFLANELTLAVLFQPDWLARYWTCQ